jgi:hypothetical protein
MQILKIESFTLNDECLCVKAFEEHLKSAWNAKVHHTAPEFACARTVLKAKPTH